MRPLVQVIVLPEIKPLPVMKCVFSELAKAWEEDDGCEYTLVSSMDQLRDGGIAFLDDAGGNYVHFKDTYDEIARRCPRTVFVCWYWHDSNFRPFSKMIYTGEYWLRVSPEDYPRLDYFMKHDYVPLKLRASDHPRKIGTYPRNVVRDYCYMGGGYRMEWIPHEYSGIYHRVIWDNYVPYAMRREIYLSSMFALGFQADANIQSGHISQRIFEGLAYGCVVLCENPMVSFYTDGIVVYIKSKEDLLEKMKYYKEHPEEVERKQRLGYAWVKKHGTNRLTTDLLKEKISELFHEEMEVVNHA
jgi:hypothetical protein